MDKIKDNWEILLLVVLLFLSTVLAQVRLDNERAIPRMLQCQEDAIIVGYGDFDGTWWEEYRCIAADDFEGKGY